MHRVFILLVTLGGGGAACGSDRGGEDAGAVDAAAADDAAADDAGSDADSDAGSDAGPPPVLRVLFIGNSYTSVNDLPAVLASLSEAEQSPVRFDVAQHTPGARTWEEHDADPEVDELIAQGWDHVVLQDQSEQPWWITEVKPALISLDAKIRAAGADTVLYMTWARRASPGGEGSTSERFSQNMYVNHYYQRHGEAVGARVAPVGRAWERALRDPSMRLHAGDGSHPNASGTYLAACVLYATLTGLSPVGLPDGGLAVEVGDAETLQRVARETMAAREAPPPPLIGEWPLSSGVAGGDLVPSDELLLGDAAGPDGAPTSATTFGSNRYAAVPYFAALNVANGTIAVHAYRDDWSAAVADLQYLVGKYQGWALYQEGTTLYAQLSTVDDAELTPLAYDAAGLEGGWHHLALTYDGTTYGLWVDGADVDSAVTSGAIRYSLGFDGETGQFTGIALGGRPVGGVGSVWPLPSPNAFTGALADLRLFDIALGAAEIQAL